MRYLYAQPWYTRILARLFGEWRTLHTEGATHSTVVVRYGGTTYLVRIEQMPVTR